MGRNDDGKKEPRFTKPGGWLLTRVCRGTGYLRRHVTGGQDLDLTHGWQIQIVQVI